MFEGHRNSAIAAGLTLVIAVSIGGYILGFGLGEQTGEYQANTDTYARHAADEIERTCAGLDGISQTECIVGVVEATNEHKRAESDSIAQRNMARWALAMLVATFAMAVITAGGVYYVWQTLKVTREIGQAQTRAYLSVQSIRLEKIADAAEVIVSIKNTGLSPTTSNLINCTITVANMPGLGVPLDLQFRTREHSRIANLGSGDELTKKWGIPKHALNALQLGSGPQGFSISAQGYIEWSTVFESDSPRTVHFQVSTKPGEVVNFGEIGEITSQW